MNIYGVLSLLLFILNLHRIYIYIYIDVRRARISITLSYRILLDIRIQKLYTENFLNLQSILARVYLH